MDITKLTLLYFSPTGTTRQIAEAIARGTGITGPGCMDITLTEARLTTPPSFNGGMVILAAPVYHGRVQPLAAEYFKRLNARKTLCIPVAVYGNREYEDALLELKDIAEGRGFIPAACGAFIGEHSFSTARIPVAHSRPDRADIKRAEKFGRDIAARIRNLNNPETMPPFTVPGSRPYRKPLTIPPIEWIATSDTCTFCGICAGLCPAGALDRDTMTTDYTSCIHCCTCIKKCPRGSRSMMPGPFTDKALELSLNCKERKEPEIYM